jgi:hypothetical protein
MNWITKLKIGYAAEYGLKKPVFIEPTSVVVDVQCAMSIADAFDKMPAMPQSMVKRMVIMQAYYEMVKQLCAQFAWLLNNEPEFRFSAWDGQGEPYANSREMRLDLLENKHLLYFPTQNGFGENSNPLTQHPMLSQVTVATSHSLGNITGCANDIFRIVHDVFGHGCCDNGFGANGEEVAWRSHREMFTGDAIGALTTETRGQNSWVNFGKHLRDDGRVPLKGEKGYIHPSKRPFAEQKIGLLPKKYWSF